MVGRRNLGSVPWGSTKLFFLLFLLGQLVKFFVNTFSTFFPTFLKTFSNLFKLFLILFLHVYTCSSCLFHGLRGLGPKGGALSQLAMGGVTCHTCHGCVTDFRPILGNPMEVTHVTSLGHVYISHAKGTSFP